MWTLKARQALACLERCVNALKCSLAVLKRCRIQHSELVLLSGSALIAPFPTRWVPSGSLTNNPG